jgi:hypothetical protein
MSGRRSYRGLMSKPAWGLFDSRGRIVASVRADTAQLARDLFKTDNLKGERVRRL